LELGIRMAWKWAQVEVTPPASPPQQISNRSQKRWESNCDCSWLRVNFHFDIEMPHNWQIPNPNSIPYPKKWTAQKKSFQIAKNSREKILIFFSVINNVTNPNKSGMPKKSLEIFIHLHRILKVCYNIINQEYQRKQWCLIFWSILHGTVLRDLI